MDDFTIDGEGDEFPEQTAISPFPSTSTDILPYDNPTATVQSPPNSQEFRSSTLKPKLKLRPIRCNSNNLMDYSNISSAVNIPPQGLMMGNGGKCSGSRLEDLDELGFLNPPPHFPHPYYAIGNGNEFHQGQTVPDGVTQVDTRSGSGPVDSKLPSRLASEVSGDSLKHVSEPVHQTKKRKSRNKLELFLETLVARVMQKQEEFQNQVIDMIEMKEKERLLREEAWKQQLIERSKKEEQLRAEETSRSLALISYIKNVFGHEIKFSSDPQNSFPEDESVAAQGERDMVNGDIAAGNEHPREGEESKDDMNNGRWWNSRARTISSQRWPESEVKALITLRAALDRKFSGTSSTLSIWEAVSAELSNMGYSRSAKKCKEKWENINKYFRRATSNGNMQSEKTKRRPYFQELEILCKQGFIRPGNACTSKADGNEEKGAGK